MKTKFIFEIVTYSVLADLTLVTLTFDLVTPKSLVSLLPRMDVLTKFEKGRSRCS